MFDCAGMQKICGRIVRPRAQNRPSRPPGRDPTSEAIAASPPSRNKSLLRRLANAGLDAVPGRFVLPGLRAG